MRSQQEALVGHVFGHPEISQLGHSSPQEYIGRLQVPMHDALPCQFTVSLHYLPQQGHCLLLPAPHFSQTAQVSLAPLHYYEDSLRVLYYFVHLDDVGVAELGEDADLIGQQQGEGLSLAG